MGTIVVDENSEPWGASSRLIYSMLVEISDVGDVPIYISRFISEFDNGYNAIFISDLSNEDSEDFLSRLVKYTENGGFNSFGNNENDRQVIRENLQKLIKMIERYLEERSR